MKLHLRFVTLGRRVLRVVGLRASERARFSTNQFHNTWHILSGCDGAALLARLLWGLSYQRHADTFVVIDRGHLATTPFDGDAADMILLARREDRIDGDMLRAIKTRLRRAPQSDKTIRFHTVGLDGASLPEPSAGEKVERLAGFVCYSAAVMAMRARAVSVRDMNAATDMDYRFIGGVCRRYYHAPGEVQIFRNFDDMVSSARVAREVVNGGAAIRSETEREKVQNEAVRRKKLLWAARAE